jgi:hypothetical protein
MTDSTEADKIEHVATRLEHARDSGFPLDRSRVDSAIEAYSRALGVETPPITWVAGPQEARALFNRPGPPLAPEMTLWLLAHVEFERLLGSGPVEMAYRFTPVQARRTAAFRALAALSVAANSRALEATTLRQCWMAMKEVCNWERLRLVWAIGLLMGAIGVADGSARIDVDRHLEALGDAVCAGLWALLPSPATLIAIPSPTMFVFRGQLHHASGPAVAWPSGERYWFWRGVRVHSSLIERRDSVEINETLRRSRHLDTRRAICEIFGWARVLEAVGANELQRDECGALVVAMFSFDGESLTKLVRVRCPSTRKEHVIPVPFHVQTAREAVDWTFGLKANEYKPSYET